MAKVVIGHHPELTKEDAMKVFEKHFTGKYEVYMVKSPFFVRDFVVKKSSWTAVAFTLKQTKNETYFTFIATVPSTMLRLTCVFFLLICALAIRGAHKKIEDEMKSFIENAEEFK